MVIYMSIDLTREEKSCSLSDNENQNGSHDLPPQQLVKLEGLRGFVETMVEDIILENKTFDSYKEELKKHCEEEEVAYDILDLGDFLECLNLGVKSPDCRAIAMTFALKDAEKCYVREEKIDEILDTWSLRTS